MHSFLELACGDQRYLRYLLMVERCMYAGGQEVPTLSYWCFEPGVAMAALCALKVRCILLTSGTLAPLDSFAQELSLDFPVTLENPHVVNTSQVLPLDPSSTQWFSCFNIIGEYSITLAFLPPVHPHTQ